MIYTELKHEYPIHIIGLGAIGSQVAEPLLRGDCGEMDELHLWDGDGVKKHNLRNQAYVKSGIGLSKVAELGRLALQWGDTVPHIHNTFIERAQPLAGIVVLCLDTMSARKSIWETCVRNNPNVLLMIETRMDALNVFLYSADPNNPDHILRWENYWYKDEDAVNEGAGCGINPSFSSTASMAASLVAWQIIRFASIRKGFDDILDNRIWMRLRPLSIETHRW